jgi:hypothetical protein
MLEMLHVAPARAIERMEQGIGASVELGGFAALSSSYEVERMNVSVPRRRIVRKPPDHGRLGSLTTSHPTFSFIAPRGSLSREPAQQR